MAIVIVSFVRLYSPYNLLSPSSLLSQVQRAPSLLVTGWNWCLFLQVMLRVAGDLDTHIKFYHEVRHVTLNPKAGAQCQQAHVHSITGSLKATGQNTAHA